MEFLSRGFANEFSIQPPVFDSIAFLDDIIQPIQSQTDKLISAMTLQILKQVQDDAIQDNKKRLVQQSSADRGCDYQ